MSELLQFSTVQRWMSRLESKRKGSPSTRKVFLYYLGRFCYQVAKKTPDQLIAERKIHLQSDDEMIRRKHEEMAESYAKMLRAEGASPNTASTAVATVRSFYRNNYYPLVEVSAPPPFALRHLKVPDKKELRAICETKRVKKQHWLKTWILAQAESGLANADLLKLDLHSKWCHSIEFGFIGEQLKNHIVPLHLHIVREKTIASGLGWYDSFLGENAVDALNQYRLLSRDQGKIFDFASDREVQIQVKKAGAEAGISSDDTPLTPYSFRKFFNTTLKVAGMNNDVVEFMMGHSLGRVKGAYFVPPVMDLRQSYIKYYPKLKI